jgi:Leucine-rich repeat (LRR) protein
LSGNRLDALPSEIKQLSETLQELDLKCNRLRQLPAAIATLTELRVLNLRSNQLKDLPGGNLIFILHFTINIFRAWLSLFEHFGRQLQLINSSPN